MNGPGTDHRPQPWLNRLAHDLRGPLSPLQTAVFLLRDERVGEPERTELLDVIERQTRRLGGMIDEVSDLTRAQSGRLIVRREDIELALLIDQIRPRLHGPAPEIRFAPGAEALQLNGDAIRLGQLLRGMLVFRLSRDDDTPVRADVERLTAGRMRLLRRIDCPGHARAQAETLLVAPLPHPPDEGLGLDLLVARAIALAHDGELQVRARDADTIELVVELPLSGAAPE